MPSYALFKVLRRPVYDYKPTPATRAAEAVIVRREQSLAYVRWHRGMLCLLALVSVILSYTSTNAADRIAGAFVAPSSPTSSSSTSAVFPHYLNAIVSLCTAIGILFIYRLYRAKVRLMYYAYRKDEYDPARCAFRPLQEQQKLIQEGETAEDPSIIHSPFFPQFLKEVAVWLIHNPPFLGTVSPAAADFCSILTALRLYVIIIYARRCFFDQGVFSRAVGVFVGTPLDSYFMIRLALRRYPFIMPAIIIGSVTLLIATLFYVAEYDNQVSIIEMDKAAKAAAAAAVSNSTVTSSRRQSGGNTADDGNPVGATGSNSPADAPFIPIPGTATGSFNILDTIYFTVYQAATINYGTIGATTRQGNTLVMLSWTFGMVAVAWLVAKIHDFLKFTSDEQNFIDLLEMNRSGQQVREHAARVLQISWRIYRMKCRSTNGGGGGTTVAVANIQQADAHPQGRKKMARKVVRKLQAKSAYTVELQRLFWQLQAAVKSLKHELYEIQSIISNAQEGSIVRTEYFSERHHENSYKKRQYYIRKRNLLMGKMPPPSPQAGALKKDESKLLVAASAPTFGTAAQLKTPASADFKKTSPPGFETDGTAGTGAADTGGAPPSSFYIPPPPSLMLPPMNAMSNEEGGPMMVSQLTQNLLRQILTHQQELMNTQLNNVMSGGGDTMSTADTPTPEGPLDDYLQDYYRHYNSTLQVYSKITQYMPYWQQQQQQQKKHDDRQKDEGRSHPDYNNRAGDGDESPQKNVSDSETQGIRTKTPTRVVSPVLSSQLQPDRSDAVVGRAPSMNIGGSSMGEMLNNFKENLEGMTFDSIESKMINMGMINGNDPSRRRRREQQSQERDDLVDDEACSQEAGDATDGRAAVAAVAPTSVQDQDPTSQKIDDETEERSGNQNSTDRKESRGAWF